MQARYRADIANKGDTPNIKEAFRRIAEESGNGKYITTTILTADEVCYIESKGYTVKHAEKDNYHIKW